MNKFIQDILDNWDKVIEHDIKHNEYLASQLDKSLDFQQYIVDNFDKIFEQDKKYKEHLASQLDKSLEYQEELLKKLNNGKV